MMRSLTLMLALGAATLAPHQPARAFDPVIDSPMYKLPDLPSPPIVRQLPDGAIELWLELLKRPEADYRCKAAQTIADAQRRGYKEIQRTIPALVAALDRPEERPVVRLALAQALIELDARQAAASLFQHAQSGTSELRCLVEPALARWDHKPARAVWLRRLDDAGVRQTELILALRGLGAVGEDKAADRLRELALSLRTLPQTRLEAAAALALLRNKGLEDDAARLAGAPGREGMTSRLVAVALLARHDSAAAIATLKKLADDAEPAIARGAVSRLIALDPDLIVGRVGALHANPDSALRLLAAEILMRRPDRQHVKMLGDLLDDVNVQVRVAARKHLLKLAEQKALREFVIAEGTRLLGAGAWRGLEQAAILLTQLDHKPAATRLVELLEFDRPEVNVTAGWALRRLAVKETLPAVTAHVASHFQRAKAKEFSIDDIEAVEHRLSQLNQFLGQERYAPADKVLRLLVPKQMLYEARAAAVWSLGLLHEGKNDPALAAQMEARMNDGGSIPPEDPRVCTMAAITLGRLGAKQAMASLKNHCPDNEWSSNSVANAACWSIARLTEQPLPPVRTARLRDLAWILVPTK